MPAGWEAPAGNEYGSRVKIWTGQQADVAHGFHTVEPVHVLGGGNGGILKPHRVADNELYARS